MENEIDNESEEQHVPTIRERLSAAGQVILGEIETIGGVLTGDPITQAEGEFNVEVGSVREEAEHDLAKARHLHEKEEESE